MQKVLLIGGSGKQSGAVYLPILLDFTRKDLKLVGIADPVDSLKSPFASKYSEALQKANIRWIPLKGITSQDLKTLDDFFEEEPFDTLAISCSPLYHGMYVEWGLKHGLDVIVDKPFICIQNQFGDINSPKKLEKEFKKLQSLREGSRHRKFKRQCIVMVPLMRRAFSPYITILKNIHEVYELTGQSLTYIQTTRSDGCFRFADEFDRPGAHGFRDGLGTLTWSGYHYLDYMAACVMAAPPKGTVLEAHMVNQSTVGDFRMSPQDIPYAKLLQRSNYNVVIEKKFIGDNAELDFSVSFKIKEPKVSIQSCLINLNFILSGCSRRVSPSYPKDSTHDEGLTNDCIMVMHQGPLQSFHWVVAQDSTMNGHITVVRRLNPVLAKKLNLKPLSIVDYELQSTENINRNRIIINGLLEKFSSSKLKKTDFDLLDAKYQDFTMELYIATLGASVNDYSTHFNKNLWNIVR